ncbi:hypothetical protein C8R44DRAFT_727211 [Mycena epipterygia]|nr:hypothetical protein C8R44DRAFT_727211 [Mycena epipterygia]
MSLEEERVARTKEPWGLASNCMMTLDNRYLQSGAPEIYYAIPNPPALELVTDNFHISDKLAPLDFPHAVNEILYEITILSRPHVWYRAIVPTPPDFLAANERSCDIGPLYKASEELCNRTALGLQQSFAKQVFAKPETWICVNPRCLSTALLGSFGPRIAVVGSYALSSASCEAER